jgi:hypothetical protein
MSGAWCPTCGRSYNHPPAKCWKCGAEYTDGSLEPLGWRYIVDPARPNIQTKLPDGTDVTLPRCVVVCEDCWREERGESGAGQVHYVP